MPHNLGQKLVEKPLYFVKKRHYLQKLLRESYCQDHESQGQFLETVLLSRRFGDPELQRNDSQGIIFKIICCRRDISKQHGSQVAAHGLENRYSIVTTSFSPSQKTVQLMWGPLQEHHRAIQQQRTVAAIVVLYVSSQRATKAGWKTQGRGKHTIKPLPKKGLAQTRPIPLSEASESGFGGRTL